MSPKARPAKIPDEDSAYRFLEDLRWGDRPVCPHCGSVRKPYFLTPKNGGRKTTRGRVSPRRVWKCADCRKQFTVLVGTIFHGPRSRSGRGCSSCSRWSRPRTGSAGPESTT